MSGNSLEEFAERLQHCSTSEQVFALYRADIEAEGYQNAVFVQLGTSEGFEVPFLNVPDGAASVYISENFAEHDPVLAYAAQSATAFAWTDASPESALSRPAQKVINVCRELGMHTGVAIPMHGPGPCCDLFSLSMRDKRRIDPTRISVIAMKSYATWSRYYEIGGVWQIATLPGLSWDQDDGTPPDAATACHRDGSNGISEAECQALVIADVSHRRYRAGLTQLNDNLTSVLGLEMFDRLKRRGLLHDEPDDMRWRYFAKPSPIARSHLRTCGAVPQLRDQIWQLHVRMDERPSD